MRIRLLTLLLLVLTLPAAALAQTKGPNGGIVVIADEHPIEFVNRGQDIVFYLAGHDGRPLSTKGMQARAIIQAGGQTTTVALIPQEPNLLIGKLAAPLSGEARIVFSTRFAGHALQARFALK